MLLDDGHVVLLEVSDVDSTGIDRVGRRADIARGASDTLQQALTRVGPALVAVVTATRGLATAPESVTVEFGVKLTAEAGVVVARGTTEANFAVTATWKTRQP
ncbi:CU044_2847 family protein [Streptomyces sp. yr375]|uniref:CU044_2847 family protein n=1 Tax=Streptomyces sp. yr375 TaxID=1761906 RepID=UPI000B89C61D|nr:CU044_2847 family protein [Streptomyces sp. yr375]